jgi:hypothetical protein
MALEKDAGAQGSLASSLAEVAERLEPTEAARVFAEAARLLSQAMALEKDADARGSLASSLAVVARRLEPAEAARLLSQALAQETSAFTCWPLAENLAAVAGRLKPAEATRVCAEAARLLSQALAREKEGQAYGLLAVGLAAVVGQLDGEAATQVARSVTLRVTSDPDPNWGGGGQFTSGDVLERLLSNSSHFQVRQRAIPLAAAIGLAAHGLAPGLPFLPAAAEPLPCRLTTQELVELLKMPTCVRERRRAILDQLGNRYGRRFDTHWDFVRYAQQQGLNLDFTTPPKRPER